MEKDYAQRLTGTHPAFMPKKANRNYLIYENKVTALKFNTRDFYNVWQLLCVSSYLSSLLLPLIPKKKCCDDCVTYIGGCHGDHPPCCQATCDWPCQPLIGRDLLKVPKMLSEKEKNTHGDTLMEFYCRSFPLPNRSCCHSYFDLCIPWSTYAFVEGSDSSARLLGPPAVHFF